MNPRHALFATLLVSLPLLIAGCGNKGPLVLAEEPPPIEDPVMPPGAVPVEIERQETLPPTIDPVPADDVDPAVDAAPDPEPEPASDEPASDPRIPIDPATVPDSPPATGTADDGHG